MGLGAQRQHPEDVTSLCQTHKATRGHKKPPWMWQRSTRSIARWPWASFLFKDGYQLGYSALMAFLLFSPNLFKMILIAPLEAPCQTQFKRISLYYVTVLEREMAKWPLCKPQATKFKSSA